MDVYVQITINFSLKMSFCSRCFDMENHIMPILYHLLHDSNAKLCVKGQQADKKLN